MGTSNALWETADAAHATASRVRTTHVTATDVIATDVIVVIASSEATRQTRWNTTSPGLAVATLPAVMHRLTADPRHGQHPLQHRLADPTVVPGLGMHRHISG